VSKHRRFVAQQRKLYDDLVAEQGGETCAICGAEPKTRRLHIDHDHRTMRVRGLLCFGCNRKLPYDATVDWLKAAVVYLEDPPISSGEIAA
jgi:hypothetical protein